MTDEQTEETVLECRIESTTLSAAKQGAATNIKMKLTVDASNDDALRNLSQLCDDPNRAYKSMKAAVLSAKQIDHDGVPDSQRIALQVAGPAKAKDKNNPQVLIGVAPKIRLKTLPEGEAIAEVFIRPNYTRELGLWLVDGKLGVDLVATFTLEQTKLPLDEPDAPAAKSKAKKKAKTPMTHQTDTNPNPK